MTVELSPKRPRAVSFSSRFGRSRAFILAVASLAIASPAVAQQPPARTRPMWADSTGESDVYPTGDAVDVYRTVLDLLYVDGHDHPPYVILNDSAVRMAWGQCTNSTCTNGLHRSDIDSATLAAYAHPSLKRPRIVKFRYRVPVALVSTSEFERMMNDGYAVLSGAPADKLGGPEVFWAGFLHKYPKAWGYAVFSKVAFNPAHTQALMSVYQNCGNGCYSSESIFLKRFQKGWRVVERIPDQISMSQTSGSLRYRGPVAELGGPSQMVATNSSGAQPRSESDDAAGVYSAVLEKLYSLYGEPPRTVVLGESRAASWMELPQHRSRIDSTTVATYKLYEQLRDAVRPALKSPLSITWISDTAL